MSSTTTPRPKQQNALKVHSKGIAKVTQTAIPTPNPDQLLVKVVAVALNVTEWMHLDWYTDPGSTLGSDYAGIVEEVGKDVVGWKVGDRVAGFVLGGNNKYLDLGACAEYIVAPADLATHVPTEVPLESAATLGMGVLTAAQSLFQTLEIPFPALDATTNKPKGEKLQVLIYGGGTSTGYYAIQLAKAAGVEVITTASPRQKEYLLSLGADHVLDYNDPTAPSQIQALTSNSLSLVLDCIGIQDTADFCMKCVRPATSGGGLYSPLLYFANIDYRPDFKMTWRLVHTSLGEDVHMGNKIFKGTPEDRRFGKEVWKVVEKLLAEGKFTPARHELVEGGLQAMPEGIDRLRRKDVGPGKLVYKI